MIWVLVVSLDGVVGVFVDGVGQGFAGDLFIARDTGAG